VTGAVPEVRPTVAALGSVPNLQPSDFLGGGVAGTTGAGGATGGFVQDAQRSNAQGGVSLDDSHGQKSIGSLFKPNSQQTRGGRNPYGVAPLPLSGSAASAAFFLLSPTYKLRRLRPREREPELTGLAVSLATMGIGPPFKPPKGPLDPPRGTCA
jgi:hypothetical protein